MTIILHNIRSVYNVGSIFRTADAVGVEKIYLCGITPIPIDRFGKWRLQLTKVSLGAEKTVPWEYQKSAVAVIKKIKGGGHKIFAVEQDKKSVSYYKIKPTTRNLDKIVLIFGNEVMGLPKSILKFADEILEIPMRGKMVRHAHHPKNYPELSRRKESLNVSVAFGIVAYHLNFQ